MRGREEGRTKVTIHIMQYGYTWKINYHSNMKCDVRRWNINDKTHHKQFLHRHKTQR